MIPSGVKIIMKPIGSSRRLPNNCKANREESFAMPQKSVLGSEANLRRMLRRVGDLGRASA
jgi:hypothetical protein